MAKDVAAPAATTQGGTASTGSVSETDLMAEDMARLEKIDSLWAFDRSVIGAKAALGNGVTQKDVEAAFGHEATVLALDANG